MNIEVRFAKTEDLEQVNVIRKQVNDVHCEGRSDIFRPGFGEKLQKHLYDSFEAKDSDVIAAVCADGICGYAIVEYVTKPETAYNYERSYCRIGEFGVDSGHRRMGIAAELIEFIKKEAGRRGFDRIELDMWEFNEGALKFYEDAGFKTYRRYMELPVSGEQ